MYSIILCLLVVSLVHSRMDHLSKIDCVKLNIKLGNNVNPPVSGGQDYSRSNVALECTITNSFLLDMHQCHEQEGHSYVSILDAHVNTVSLFRTERLETILRVVCGSVRSKQKKLNVKGSKKEREAFPLKEHKFSILKNEVLDANELVLNNFKFKAEKLNLQKKYDEVLSSLQKSSEQNAKLVNDLEKVRAENAELAKYLQHFMKSKKYVNSGRPLDSVTDRQRRNKLQSLKTYVNGALWFAKTYDLEPTSIKCRSTKTDKDVTLNLLQNESKTEAEPRKGRPKSPTFDELNEDDQLKIKQITLLLDTFGISDSSYHELNMICDGIPRKSLIVQCKTKTNKFTEIKRLPGGKDGKHGAYVSFKSELGHVLMKNPTDLSPQIKFAGDGTKISQLKNYLVLSFVPVSGTGDQSVKSHHVLAILEGAEDYESLKTCCSPVLNEVNDVIANGLDVESVHFSPELFLGGDMKFLNTILGLNVNFATAAYSCPFCRVLTKDRGDMTKPMDFYSSPEFQRDFTKQATINSYGHKYPSLITIATDRIVLCALHLLLRITDTVEGNLVSVMVERDTRAKVDKQPQTYLTQYIQLVRDCGISYNVWQSTEKHSSNTVYNRTSLTGDLKLKLMVNLPDKLQKSDLLYNDTKDKICDLLRDFVKVFSMVNHGQSEDADTIFLAAQAWVNKYEEIAKHHFWSNPTHYMHCLVYHSPQYVRRYGSLKKFSGQGVEKLNDVTKFIFHHKTSRWDGPMETMAAMKRVENLQGVQREVRPHTKRNKEYWEKEIFNKRAAKRRKIEAEVEATKPSDEISIQDVDDMSCMEIRSKLKSLGITTRLRAHKKLAELLKSTLETSTSSTLNQD